MTTADGRVSGHLKLVDHGANSARWNLTLLGDGYQEHELHRFAGHADAFVAALKATEPFQALWAAINIHRVDIISRESGVDDPITCEEDRPPTGAVAATYLDATFCSVGPGNVRVQRLLTVNSKAARKAALDAVPETHQVLVIVNTEIYGGAGGQVAVVSAHPDSAHVAIHELGHSFASLADEYQGNGTGSPSGEPREVNITRERKRARIKWRAMIASSTPLPTSCNCCTAANTVVPAATIGLFEGGGYSDCDIFRPSADCKMRDFRKDFCAVCQAQIARRLAPFAPAHVA